MASSLKFLSGGARESRGMSLGFLVFLAVFVLVVVLLVRIVVLVRVFALVRGRWRLLPVRGPRGRGRLGQFALGLVRRRLSRRGLGLARRLLSVRPSEQFERARALVGAPEWLVLVSEWLSAPPQVEALARALCFATDGNGRGIEVDGELVPSFKAKRAAGGHSRERPRGWAPNASTLEALWRDNAHDLHLYEWAARGVHSRLVAEGTMGAGPLPLLPPVSSARAFHAWLVQCRDEPASAGCARGRVFYELDD